MAELKLYGLKNCDACRKAMNWLDANDLTYRFHDVRADGLSETTVRAWFDASDWQTVVNRRSTTWRSIPAETREAMDADRALGSIIEQPTLAKRPVLEGDGFTEVGFNADRYRDLLG